MKSIELKEYLEKQIKEFGDLDVVVFPGDGEWLKKIKNVSRAETDRPVSEQQIWIEI